MSSADQAWRRLKATNPINPELLPSADMTRLEGYKAAIPRGTPGARRSALRAMRPALGVTALILGIGAVLLLALPRGTDSPSATPPSTSSPNLPGPSGSDGSPVLTDFMDNGVIDACYSDAEFASALGELSADAQQYGSAVSAIEQRQAECRGDTDPPASPVTTVGTSTKAPVSTAPSGELTFAAIQATVADFNARYSECMEANGANLVTYPGEDAWSWSGATETAMKACAPLLRAGEDYMRQRAVRELVSRPDYFKFLRCMNPVLKGMPPSARFTAKEEAAARQCSEGLNG